MMGNSRRFNWHGSRDFPAYRIAIVGSAVGGMIALT
jgi:hypothetical protein